MLVKETDTIWPGEKVEVPEFFIESLGYLLLTHVWTPVPAET